MHKYNLDIAIMVKTNDRQIVVVANDIDIPSILRQLWLSFLCWFLADLQAILDDLLGWLDKPIAKLEVISIWFKHIMWGMGGELLCKAW